MHWKLKCLAFKALDQLPFARPIHSAAQRYLTRRYFQRITDATLATYNYHVESFRSLPAGAVALEFGAGRNLLTPLLLSAAGAGTVHAVDLERIATVEQVNDVIAQLRGRVPGAWPAISSLEDLLPMYRIDYRAPGDARATGLPDASVDFIYSTSTLEHIPPADIRSILIECRRIASPRALFSFVIDYHDHYGTADPRIGRFHFYRYSDDEWRSFNPSNHFQNRLRHSEHERLFAELGFETLRAKRVIPAWAEPDLGRATVAPRFAAYSHEDLVTANGLFLLRPGLRAEAPR